MDLSDILLLKITCFKDALNPIYEEYDFLQWIRTAENLCYSYGANIK